MYFLKNAIYSFAWWDSTFLAKRTLGLLVRVNYYEYHGKALQIVVSLQDLHCLIMTNLVKYMDTGDKNYTYPLVITSEI